MSYPLLTIREISEKFDVTPRALRFYESKKLITPTREGQRRLYSPNEQARLALIIRAKRYGFSLEEASKILDIYSARGSESEKVEQIFEIAQEQLAALKKQRDSINESIRRLEQDLEGGLSVLSDCTAFRRVA